MRKMPHPGIIKSTPKHEVTMSGTGKGGRGNQSGSQEASEKPKDPAKSHPDTLVQKNGGFQFASKQTK